jgi:hypothetical protein
MILYWNDLVACYGVDVVPHRRKFESADWATYAMFCSRLLRSGSRVVANDALHAEGELLRHRAWRSALPAALRTLRPSTEHRTIGVLVLNRSPCRECTKLLIAGLNELAVRLHALFPNLQAILACRGAYLGRAEPDEDGQAWYRQATTTGDLERLDDAGWRVCVLQVGSELSTRGKWLLEAIERLPRNVTGPRVPV